MIKPTVGRVVHFWPDRADEGQPNAAIIAFVHSDTSINITRFDNYGNPSSIMGVHLHQQGNERPTHCFAEWMSYQQGQATRKEAPPVAETYETGSDPELDRVVDAGLVATGYMQPSVGKSSLID